MLKVLVFSRTAWKRDNSFGNTYSNWFSQLEDVRVAHICLADGLPFGEHNVDCYYQVSEKTLAKSVFKKHRLDNAVGKEVYPIEPVNNASNIDMSFFGRLVSYCKVHRLPLFFLLREAIWKYGNINYLDMKSFIERFSPDVVFMPMYYAGYVDRVAINVLKSMKIPIVLEAAIDVYTLKQLSFDPFFWINRFYVRHMTRQICKESEMLYVISDKMKADYRRLLNIPIKVIYKFPDLSRSHYSYREVFNPVRYLYTGNLGSGRWNSLSLLVKALKETGHGVLDIYTSTPLSNKARVLLNVEGISTVHSPISQAQVIELQNSSDVLVHVESFELKNKLEVRFSISTKIMDYISVGRCILAIGPSDIASMMYLKSNNLAYTVNNKEELSRVVKELNTSNNAILDCAKRNSEYMYGINSDELRNRFKQDLIDASKMIIN